MLSYFQLEKEQTCQLVVMRWMLLSVTALNNHQWVHFRYGIMYRFRVIAINDAGPSEPGDPSEPVVIDVPGVQIAPYFVQLLNDTIALEHEKVRRVFFLFISPVATVE